MLRKFAPTRSGDTDLASVENSILVSKATRPSTARSKREAFTLVELLVVIGIIALLISILLPSLAKARKAANTVVCASNLHQIAQAMVIYATQNNGAILGNQWTSGYFLFPSDQVNNSTTSPGIGPNNCPGVLGCWDWMSPVAMVEGIKLTNSNAPGSVADRAARAALLTSLRAFRCPENDIVALDRGDLGVTTYLASYTTSAYFQVAYNINARYANDPKYKQWVNMGDYHPKIAQVGDPSWKVFISDGASWCDTQNPPYASFSWDNGITKTKTTNQRAGLGGTPWCYFADPGPWDAFTRSFSLSGDTNGADQSPPNGRMYAFRHGSRGPGVTFSGAGSTTTEAKNLRFNAAFFDGHVETMTCYQADDPSHWLPKGSVTQIDEISMEVQNDPGLWPGGPGSQAGCTINR